MVIYIMRHGKCTDNASNPPILNGTRDTHLVDIGRKQAEESALKLVGANIKMIYSSPLCRAYETAMIAARILDPVDIDIDPNLRERHFGVLTGKLVSEIPLFSKVMIKGDRCDYFLDTEGAEHYDDVYNRALDVIEKVLCYHAKENVLLVTHGAIGQAIRAAFYGWTWQEAFKKMPYFDNTDIIKLDPIDLHNGGLFLFVVFMIALVESFFGEIVFLSALCFYRIAG